MPTSNIDDLLLQGNSSKPTAPEAEYAETPEEVEEDVVDSPSEPEDAGYDEPYDDDIASTKDDEPEEKESFKEDEYGNQTEDLSKSMQKRLERQAESLRRKHEMEMAALRAQLTPQQQHAVKQAERSFEADPNSDADWQQQLDAYIEQAVTKMQGKRERDLQDAEERRLQSEFEDKFFTGMQKFGDFKDVIDGLGCEITNPMTYATRSMTDPAAFLYAAAKRHPQELERISSLRDPYAQVAEMGKLEERMRRNKPATSAPRPLERVREDTGMPAPKTAKKEETIEDLIAKSQAKKLTQVRMRQGRR